MRIGLLSEQLPYLPSAGGFRLYGANLIRCLSRRHEIHLIAFAGAEDRDHLQWARDHCASVAILEPSPMRPLIAPLSIVSAHLFGAPLQGRRTLSRALPRPCPWDVLHVEGPYAAGLVPTRMALPMLLSAHDSWTLRCEELLKCAVSSRERLYYTMLRHHEPRYQRLVYPRFGRCVFVTERDAAAVKAVVPDARCSVVPNGVDTDYYRPTGAHKAEHTVVFHGHLSYGPNVEAACLFAETIFPLVRRSIPEAVFRLVGAHPTPRVAALAGRPGVQLSANVADIRPLLTSSQVYVSAVKHGTGIKNKILEAMALNLPIVCFQESIEGIPAESGGGVTVARDPEGFASAVAALLRSPALAQEQGCAGRALVERQFSWDARAAAFETLYSEIQMPDERTHVGLAKDLP